MRDQQKVSGMCGRKVNFGGWKALGQYGMHVQQLPLHL